MSIFCKIGIHKWMYSQEFDGDSTNAPVGTPDDPSFRICKSCYKKEYIVIGNKKRFLRRSPTKSDIRMVKLDKLFNK